MFTRRPSAEVRTNEVLFFRSCRCRRLPSVLFRPAIGKSADKPASRETVDLQNGVTSDVCGPHSGQPNIEIPFTSGQLNDVLKSLFNRPDYERRPNYGSGLRLDRTGGPATRRPAAAPLARAAAVLGVIRGARLDSQRNDGTLGPAYDVERKTRIAGGTTLEVDYLSLISENGDVRTMELAPGFSVQMRSVPPVPAPEPERGCKQGCQ